MKLENKELIEKWKSAKYDSKHKLNTSMREVSTELIADINNGITIENLDKLQKTHKLPIYHYQTQITIHGLFTDLGWNYINGYKNVLQNKNKSIGIRWNAIDAEKRKRIAEKLQYVGLTYRSNSSNHSYMRVVIINEENYAETLAEFKTLLQGFQKSSFYGNASIYAASYYGQKVLVIEACINAIYESEITNLIQNLGITSELIESIDNKEQAKREARDKEYQTSRDTENQKKEALALKVKAEIDACGITIEKARIEQGYGFKIDYNTFEDDNYYTYTLMYVYKEGRKKYPRMNEVRDFKTFKDVLQYIKDNPEGETWSSDRVAKTAPKAYRIKS